MKELIGTADIEINKQRKTVKIAVDLGRGIVTVPTSSGELSNAELLYLSFHSFTTNAKPFNLYDVQIDTPAGSLFAKSIGPFLIRFVRSEEGEDMALASSLLGSILSDTTAVPAISRIELTPMSSMIDFDLVAEPQPSGSEVYLYCPFARQMELSVSVSEAPVSVRTLHPGSHFSDYIVANSDLPGLTKNVTELRIALSLLLRARVSVHAMRDAGRITLNLVTPNKTYGYGHLVGPEHLASALERLITHVGKSRKGKINNSHYFLIEAFANPGTLEVRLLNAFVYLEIIDNSRTLSPNELRRELNITRINADVVAKVRNKMIHNGCGIADALAQTKLEIKNQSRAQGNDDPCILDHVFQTEHPPGYFYQALMDLLSLHLAETADIPTTQIRHHDIVAFRG